jgi:hypothetical protein
MVSQRYNREAFARRLLEYFKSTRRISAKYTRVFSEYKRLTEDEVNDPEQILTSMNSLLSKYHEQASRICY